MGKMKQNYDDVVNYILRELREGRIDSELYVALLEQTGLTESEAEKALDALIRKVEDEQ